MASVYPGALDSFATNRTDATTTATTHAADHNDANDALNKIEAELGSNPAGSFVDVLARLNARTTVRKTADSAGITSTTLVNVTDLSFALAANTDYSFGFWLPHSAGTAGGSGWALTLGGTITRIIYVVEIFGHTANSATGTDTTVVGVATASATKISNSPTAGLTTTAARIHGNAQMGGTGGTLQVQASRGGGATGVNVVVFKGSDGWLQAS